MGTFYAHDCRLHRRVELEFFLGSSEARPRESGKNRSFNQDSHRGSILHRYLGEFDFRYNNRKVPDGERALQALKGFEGKRLTYKATDQEN